MPDNGATAESGASATIDGAEIVGSKPRRSSIRFPIFFAALALTAGVLALNQWIDSEPLPIDQEQERVWSERVAKMSAWEANILQLRLQLREARENRFAPFLAGNTSAVLGQFFLVRGQVPAAISAMERAAEDHFKAVEAGQPEYRRDIPHNFAALRRVSVVDIYNAPTDWRSERLCRLYMREKQYDKAAALMDRLLKQAATSEVTSGEVLTLHSFALDVYTHAGQKQKADSSRKILQTSFWIPQNCSITPNAAQAHADLRTENFQYALSLIYDGRGAEAAEIFKQVAYDQYSQKHHTDDPDFLAAAHLMIPVAFVSAKKWDEAQKYFPRALRLAQQQGTTYEIDARVPLWSAYGALLQHQGKASEAVKFLERSRKKSAQTADELSEPTPSKFADADLYASEPPK